MNPARCIVLLAISSLGLIGTPATSTSSSTPFTIHWTAPGDDSLIGRASVYDLRYSNLPLTPANFSQATRIVGLPPPAVSGTRESFVVSGLPDDVPLYLAIKTVDKVGNWSSISNVLARSGQTASADLLRTSFSSPWPNPARSAAHWTYSVAQTAQVQIDLFDIAGRHVHTIASGEREPSTGTLTWDLRDDRGLMVDAGVYLVKARIGTLEWTKRLIVVR